MNFGRECRTRLDDIFLEETVYALSRSFSYSNISDLGLSSVKTNNTPKNEPSIQSSIPIEDGVVDTIIYTSFLECTNDMVTSTGKVAKDVVDTISKTKEKNKNHASCVPSLGPMPHSPDQKCNTRLATHKMAKKPTTVKSNNSRNDHKESNHYEGGFECRSPVHRCSDYCNQNTKDSALTPQDLSKLPVAERKTNASVRKKPEPMTARRRNRRRRSRYYASLYQDKIDIDTSDMYHLNEQNTFIKNYENINQYPETPSNPNLQNNHAFHPEPEKNRAVNNCSRIRKCSSSDPPIGSHKEINALNIKNISGSTWFAYLRQQTEKISTCPRLHTNVSSPPRDNEMFGQNILAGNKTLAQEKHYDYTHSRNAEDEAYRKSGCHKNVFLTKSEPVITSSPISVMDAMTHFRSPSCFEGESRTSNTSGEVLFGFQHQSDAPTAKVGLVGRLGDCYENQVCRREYSEPHIRQDKINDTISPDPARERQKELEEGPTNMDIRSNDSDNVEVEHEEEVDVNAAVADVLRSLVTHDPVTIFQRHATVSTVSASPRHVPAVCALKPKTTPLRPLPPMRSLKRTRLRRLNGLSASTVL